MSRFGPRRETAPNRVRIHSKSKKRPPIASSPGDESRQRHTITLRRAQVIDFVYTDPDTAKTTKTKRVIKRLTGERKTNKSTKENDYEVQFKAPHDGDDCKHFYGYKKLVKWGWCARGVCL